MPVGVVVIFFGHSDRFWERAGQGAVALFLVGVYGLRERVPQKDQRWREVKDASFSSRDPERRTKPISRQEKELTEALDFLVRNLQDPWRTIITRQIGSR